MNDAKNLASIYLDAKEVVICAGYDGEIDWQSDVQFESIGERDFLREAAWVVLSAGFRETVARRYFGGVSEAFLDWRDARVIDSLREQCESRAMAVFGNRRKISGIAGIVNVVAGVGMDAVKRGIGSGGIGYLQELPFIGPVTSYHLAKNIGLPVVKPDRHLLRIAALAGYDSPLEMCLEVAGIVGDSVEVIDLVLWRYATLTKRYDLFQR